tara:strand:+ start:119014 stop:119484 length:471 start_codon:yes stop_codon:yes gene_type:complete
MNYIKSISIGICMLTFSLLFSSEILAQSKGSNGLGLMIGDPTGISFKSWTSSKNAFDLGAAWSLENNGGVSIHGDYLWHSWLNVEKGNLAFYYGIGARARFIENNDTSLGARIPLGITYLFADAPLDLFIEVAPVVDLIPDTDANGDGAIGLRYYF